VVAWALAGDLDPATARSNTFEMEWPPRSGRRRAFPEIDRVEWFDLEAARTKILPAQVPLLDRLRGGASPDLAVDRDHRDHLHLDQRFGTISAAT
jgi:Predicted NTP pyrophosphohydrolase